MNFVKVTETKLDLNEISALIIDDSCSGITFYVETVKDSFEDVKEVLRDYEACNPIELEKLTEICERIRINWTDDIQHIAIYQRCNEFVPVKEAIFIIGVSSLHQQTSLNAVRYATEEFKKIIRGQKLTRAKKIIKRKLQQINFNDCQVDEVPLPKYMVQISVDASEIHRRINCFVERKREEIDINNVKDFIDNAQTDVGSDYSCARVNSSVYRRDLGNHLKIHRVKNEYGPQTKSDEYMGTLDKLMFASPNKNDKETPQTPLALSLERFENAEKFLHVKSERACTIYDRIKRIEDRILHLETVSPEYNHFLRTNIIQTAPKIHKKSYSINELEDFIGKLQQNVKKKLDH